jgi:hypothetical protein
VRWPLADGPHTLRWTWQAGSSVPLGSTSLNRLLLDRVQFALDRPDLAALFPGNAGTALPGTHPWTAQPAPGGGFRAESNPVSPGQSSILNLTVSGGSELSFRTGWTGLRDNRTGGCFLSTGNFWYGLHGLAGIPGDTLEAAWHLPPGSHELRWTASSASGALDAFFLDQVTREVPALTVGEALGLPAKVFLSTGTGRWHGQSESFHLDGAAVASPGSGSLTTLFTGPGTVSWWWKGENAPAASTASLIGYPYGDMAVYANHRGSFGWERREALLPAGQTFRLEWRFATPNTGRLLVDDVVFREAAADSYTKWAVGRFVAGGERAVMNADPDGDGQSNLMEFAFGSDPNSRRSAYTQNITIAPGSFQVCVTMPDYDTTGLNYDIELSADLQEWTRVRRIEGGVNQPGVPVICSLPLETEGSVAFVRIKVTLSGE